MMFNPDRENMSDVNSRAQQGTAAGISGGMQAVAPLMGAEGEAAKDTTKILAKEVAEAAEGATPVVEDLVKAAQEAYPGKAGIRSFIISRRSIWAGRQMAPLCRLMRRTISKSRMRLETFGHMAVQNQVHNNFKKLWSKFIVSIRCRVVVVNL